MNRMEPQGNLIGYKPSEPTQRYRCDSAILDLKFSGDGKYLFAVCEDGIMYLFTAQQEMYFSNEENIKK